LLCLSLPVIVTGIGLFTLSKVQFDHYLLPVLPCLCLVAGIAIEAVSELAARSQKTQLAMVVASAIALASPNLWRETRSAWALRKIALDDANLNLVPSAAAVERNLELAKTNGFTGRADYWANLGRMIALDRKNPHYDLYVLYESDNAEGYLDYLQSRNVEYFIHSKRIERFFGNTPSSSQGRQSLYNDLESRTQVVAVFDPTDGRYRGSPFAIYRIPRSAAGTVTDRETSPSPHRVDQRMPKPLYISNWHVPND
jgi:hypothetical protein